jgi:hypothetical protein
MDHEQGDDPAWYEQQDDPPLLNSDFDLCGDYRHHIVYKSNLTPDTYTPTGRILVHENDVFFDTPGDVAFVDAHSNEHNDTDVNIEAATDHCVFWANAHRYVCSENTDPDVDTCPSHHGPRKVLEAPRDYDARIGLLCLLALLSTNSLITTYSLLATVSLLLIASHQYLSLAQVSYNQGHHRILPIHSGLDCYIQGS